MFPQSVVMLMLLAIALPQADLERFAGRVAQSAAAAGAGTRVLLRVEDPGNTGAAAQLTRAMQDALRQRGIETAGQGNAALQITAYLSTRNGHPLAAARIVNDSREVATLLAEFVPAETAAAAPSASAVAVRTRMLLPVDSPVLDVDADTAGHLFVLEADTLRVYDLAAPSLALKAEVGLDTGAERLRDPLVRLSVDEAQKTIAIYTAAPMVGQPPPMPLEGYTLKSFAAPAAMAGAPVRIAAGRNFFTPDIYAFAPLPGASRARWALLDRRARLRLADSDLRAISTAPGEYGGDLAATTVPCAGTLVLATAPEVNPSRDRITLLRLDDDRLTPYSAVEIDAAVTRLKTVSAGKVLAVTAKGIEEVELRCTP